MEKFLWGASTAAAQIEGGYADDGKGLSIWDEASLNGHIRDGHSTFTTCDAYHRTDETVRLLKTLGANSYRFSLSWPRIIPDGTGEINEKGVKYYDNLIDELLKNGIEPFVTLYHWDLPSTLQKRGGLLNEEFSAWFEYYAETVAKLFGKKVKYFTTFNEPECICYLGYGIGSHAPYIKGGTEAATAAAHNLLLANGRAFRAIKKYAGNGVKVGFVIASAPRIPASEKDENAARKATYDSCYYDKDSFFNNAHFSDPIFLGRYPENIVSKFSRPFAYSGKDVDIIKCDMDFIGLNIYQGVFTSDDGKGGYYDPHSPVNTPKSLAGANFTPTACYYGPKFAYERYKVPVYVTENGVSLTDALGFDGVVHDDSRTVYIHDYVSEVIRAKKDGVDIRGYFHWSLYDNLEWGSGFTCKFGICHTDFQTFEKTPKDSFWYYKKIIKENENI